MIATNIEKLSILAAAFIYISTDFSQKRVVLNHYLTITMTIGTC